MPMTPREMIKHLKKNGFEEISQNGSHIKTEESDDRENGNRSLSLQSHEKGAGAGNIKTGGA